MTPAVLVAWIMGGTAMAGAAFAAISAYRSARVNAKTTRDVATQQNEVTAYSAQISAWREDVKTLREQRAEDRREYEEDRAEFEAHKADCAQRVEVAEAKVRVAEEKVAELTRRIEGEVRLREELVLVEEQMRWLRRDRADQIRRDHLRAAFDASLMAWLNEWLPRARAAGVEVSDPPVAPTLPPLLDPDIVDAVIARDPDGGPHRRWTDMHDSEEESDVEPDARS